MGKPRHHCDPKPPPYVKYVTTAPPIPYTVPPTIPTEKISFPNSAASCPDLSHTETISPTSSCEVLKGQGQYESPAVNVCDDCTVVKFDALDHECSKGAIVNAKCCGSNVYRDIMVSGANNAIEIAAESKFKVVYGKVQFAPEENECLLYPVQVVSGCDLINSFKIYAHSPDFNKLISPLDDINDVAEFNDTNFGKWSWIPPAKGR